MKPYQQYLYAILQNPEWMKSVTVRYGNGQSVGMPELAQAVSNLENSLARHFDVDEDVSEAPSSKEFDVDGFMKDSDPPPAG